MAHYRRGMKMFDTIFGRFITDYAAKIIHSGSLVLVTNGIATNDQAHTLEGAAGVIVSLAFTAAMKLIAGKPVTPPIIK